jgi:asparagine synthase (glutamine-hydrolysing)
MCRIAGIIDSATSTEVLETTVSKMIGAMARGGPDGLGIWADSNIGLALGHRRLALLDLSEAGHQPMYSQNKNLVITYNGEIYNFKELRKELIDKGLRFYTQTDTEVILAAYQTFGTDCFAKFNGMFAFALVDLQAKKLFLVRDSAGIKPMYYSLQNNTLLFASEIRAFQAIPNKYQEEPLWKTLFLTFGHLPEPYTTVQEITILPKGHFISFDLQNLNKNTGNLTKIAAKETVFYQNTFTETIKEKASAVKLVRETFIAAVERHLVADAPVGIFMSGGVDSSLIALIADKILKKENNHTLSIVFKESKYSEKKYQEIVAAQLRNTHQYFEVGDKDFFEAFEDIQQAADQPSIDGINTYFISKFAKQAGLKAVLSGVGADELFGGYSTFQRAKYLPYTNYVPNFTFNFIANFATDKYKKIGFLGLPDQIGKYLFFRGLFMPKTVANLLDITEKEVYLSIEKIFVGNKVANLSIGNQISWQEFNLYMQNQLLKDSDVMSMWHSLELRTPFLDKELVDLAHQIDSNTKFYDSNRTKELLLAAFADILPEAVWNRPKQGFTFPFQEWLQKQTQLLQTTTNNNHTRKKLFADFEQGNLHWSRIWAVMQVT